MNELDKLKNVYSELEVPFVVRHNGNFSYLFKGEPEDARDLMWMEDNFKTTHLDTLLLRNPFFEFEDGRLVSC